MPPSPILAPEVVQVSSEDLPPRQPLLSSSEDDLVELDPLDINWLLALGVCPSNIPASCDSYQPHLHRSHSQS